MHTIEEIELTEDIQFIDIKFEPKYIPYPFWAKIIHWENVKEAYKNTQRGAPRLKISALKFKEDEIFNLGELYGDLRNGRYYPGGYIRFLVYEPKERVIYAPIYRDKIVQHMINNVLRDYYEPKFIFDSYACIRGKGNQAAVLRIQEFQRKAYSKWKDPYFLKLDISKFFYTIDKNILKRILYKDIECPLTMLLLCSVIDSFTEPLGLPLGNLTSQLFANIYLNEIDQYIKRVLKIKYYVRYADDMFIIVETKEEAKRIKKIITEKIYSELKLTINPKKAYITKADCIHGLGFNIRPTHITLLSRNKRGLRKLIKKNNINSLNSWYGYAHIASCYNFIMRSIEGTDIDFVDNKFIRRNHG